ncbi:TPA: conjugal transfer mating-pair stabilization protein TraG [Escherichia coli]
MNNPLEAVTQAVNSLVTALKLPDESAKANEVLGEMSFPQFSRLLPYRDYNQESGLFMNDTTMGFMLEAIPINGANESIVEALDHMLRTKLPRGIPLCIHLMSSQLVGDRIEYGLREFSWSGEQAERFNAITRAYYMKAAATQFPLPEGMNLPLTLRHYRVFISYCSPSKKKSRADILEMENLVKIIRASLLGASITTQTVDAQAFIDIVGEMINHNPDSLYPKRRQLDPYSDLNYQCVEDSFDLKVRADYLTLGLRENGRNSTARILNFHLARNPEIAFLWNVADNYSNLLNPELSISCPFSLVNLATTSSMEKQRLAHVSIGHVAMRTLPMTQTILTGIAIGIFPLLVLAAVFNKLTLSVLKGYVFALMWLQSWPMLYAILNSAMTFYAKQNGAPVVLSEISQIQLKYSDLASTAGYLSMMIPPLSWMMVRGLGAGFSSVYSHFASSAISPTASAAGSVVDGNYSYGNMQTENVNGFSWSTNSTTSFGQMMYQTGSGATATQTRDGNMVMDASGAMSRLPVGINTTRQIAAAQQEMAREASNRAESALHGFSSSIASAWNTLSQFGSNRGSSDSVTGGADSTMSAQDSMMASRMRSAVESYAKAHNISNEQATQELASRSTRASAGMYGDAHAEWGVKPKILGVGGGLGVRGGGRAGIDWSDDDAHQASSGSRASYDARHDIDAKASKDFKEASDYFTSRKVSESGSHTDNNADSRVDQLSAALNSAKQSYDQYTTNMTRSHEYAEMASRTESMSGQMSEDLSQQFAQYVMKHAPQDAEAILTNTSSPEIAERRRAMAWSFVQEQIQPGVDNAWRESRGDIGKGMESVPSGGGSQDIIADHQGHQAIIEQRTQDSNIRNDVKHQVDNMVTEYKGNIGDTQNSIRGEENIVRGQYSELQNHHKTEALSQNNKYNEEKSAQERMPGADSPQELMKRAKEYQDKYKQ